MTSNQFNPFTAQTAGKYFVGREEQLKVFHTHLSGLSQAVPNHLYVAGIHGTGKTSFLERVEQIARERGFVGVLATLDDHSESYDHIAKLLRLTATSIDQRRATDYLRVDWDRGIKSTMFKLARVARVESDLLEQDLLTLAGLAKESGAGGLVLCIDEGQRMPPAALSSIKNAVQRIDSYLLLLALRVTAGDALREGRILLDKKAQEAEGDFGASRLFVNGIPKGAFDSDEEAATCIRKRLEANPIDFSKAAVHHISRLTGRIPSDIVSFCSALYLAAVQTDCGKVDATLVKEVFRKDRRTEYLDAKRLCATISQVEREVLLSLSKHPAGVLIQDIVHEWGVSEEHLISAAVAAVEVALAKLCDLAYVRSDSRRFLIADPKRIYALELVLEEEK